jgi:hypothetical protein
VAKPESTRKIQVRLDSVWSDAVLMVASAMPQVKKSTTVVRIAVARLGLTPDTPSFARIAVAPAKKADNKAQINQFFNILYLTFDCLRPLVFRAF